MVLFNSENERIKRDYFEWEKEANGKSVQTINNIITAIYQFEQFAQFKDFRLLNKDMIITFKKELMKKTNQKTGKPVSKTYLFQTVKCLINFFKWLAGQDGYKRKIKHDIIAYFKLSDKDMQIARAPKSKEVPTINQVENLIKAMPDNNEVQKRNRALIAFLVLTGIRVNAVTSLKLKHVRLDKGYIEQNPEEVKTKFGKKIVTYFFPVGDFFKEIFVDWYNFLREEKKFHDDAPLFPNTKLSFDQNDQFQREELDKIPWQTTAPIRKIVKKAFQLAGLPYYNPHSFRNMLTRFGYDCCKTPEHTKAWSQNFGHSSVLTMLTSYGEIESYRQGEIIQNLSPNNVQDDVRLKGMDEKMDLILKKINA